MTTLFQTMTSLQAAFMQSGSLLDLEAMEQAERAYEAALTVARDIWAALPEGEAKDSAETNANETEGLDAGDRLAWFGVAVRSYHLTEA